MPEVLICYGRTASRYMSLALLFASSIYIFFLVNVVVFMCADVLRSRKKERKKVVGLVATQSDEFVVAMTHHRKPAT